MESSRNDQQADVDAGTRAGGDVTTKGPSLPPSDEGLAGTRAGGDVTTKGADRAEAESGSESST